MPRKIDPNTLNVKHGVVPSKSVDDNAFLYPERDVDPLRVHLHDPSRAHMASAIGIVDAADCYISDEVEGALQELCTGWGAGRMNGLIEGGYIVSPPDASGNPPYPAPTIPSGLEVTLVAPATGNPSTVLIGAHTVDISGATYDFATGTDPVGGGPTNAAGTYYLYVETDSASGDYRDLVASTTLPTVAQEKILIAQITHDGTDITAVVDCRYFVANLDRKLPYTLRAGIPTGGLASNGTFGGENADTWGEALFQTLEAALFWITNYDGPGDTQEEKATVIVRGRQILRGNYLLPAGVCLQGSGVDAEIVWQGQGSLFTLQGNHIRFRDLRITWDNDVPTSAVAIAAASIGAPITNFSMERCVFSGTTLDWTSIINASNTADWAIEDCKMQGGRNGSNIFTFSSHDQTLFIEDCIFRGGGADGADIGVHITGPQNDFEGSITNCAFSSFVQASGPTTGWVIRADNGKGLPATLRVTNCTMGDETSWPDTAVRSGVYSDLKNTLIRGNQVRAAVGNAGAGAAIYGFYLDGASATQSNGGSSLVIDGNLVYVNKGGGANTWAVDEEPTGILVAGVWESPKVVNNNVKGEWINTNPGNTSGAILGSGIGFHVDTATSLSFPDDGVIANNYVANKVLVEGAPNGLTVTGNHIQSDTSGATVENLLVGNGSRKVIITGNTFLGSMTSGDGARWGVRVLGSESERTSHITVTGNTCVNHDAAGIAFTGSVGDSNISGNVLSTEWDVPVGEGIQVAGVNLLGSASRITIDGNQIHRWTRGIRVSGYYLNDAVNPASDVVVSNNTIEECAEGVDSAWSEDTPLVAAQGILLAYTAQATVVGNNINTVGLFLNQASGVPVPGAPTLNYWGIGIHAFCTETSTISDNTIHNLYCSDGNPGGEPFTMGIYFANSPSNSVDVSAGGHVCSDNTIIAPYLTYAGMNRNNNLAGIGVLAYPRVDAIFPPIHQTGMVISGNLIRSAEPDVDPDEVPEAFIIGGGSDGPGGCGIFVGAKYEDISEFAAGTAQLDGVQITDNEIVEFGNKGILVYGDGWAGYGDGVEFKSLSVQGNQIFGWGKAKTTTTGTSSQMDGGFVFLARGQCRMTSTMVSGNSVRHAMYSGVSVGWVPNHSLSTANDLIEIHDFSITDNDIQALHVANPATPMVETYGVLLRTLWPTGTDPIDDFSMIQPATDFSISGNRIGIRPPDPGANGTGVSWGVFLAFSQTNAGAPRVAMGGRRIAISDNQIASDYACFTLDQDHSLATGVGSPPQLLEEVLIADNECFRRHDVYVVGGINAYVEDRIMTLRCPGTRMSGITLEGNQTVVYRDPVTPPAGDNLYGLSIFQDESSGMGDNIRITNNVWDSASKLVSGTYTESAVDVDLNSAMVTNIVVDNNSCTGRISFQSNRTVADSWPNVARVSICGNKIGDPLLSSIEPGRWGSTTAISVKVTSVTPPAGVSPHWTGTGITGLDISNNLVTAHEDATTSNTEFQVPLYFENVNVHKLRFSSNQVTMRDTPSAGGALFRAEGYCHCFDWDVTDNQMLGGGKPHFFYEGMGQSIASNMRFERNQCTMIFFPDGGWGAAAGHPDSVILFEGSALEISDHEGDEMISISENAFYNIKSFRPDVADPGGVGMSKVSAQNSAIYFGPSPTINFQNATGDENWQAVRNIAIDGNRMAQIDMDGGITFNVYPVALDVSNVSISRNKIGQPTKNITDLMGTFVTPRVGIDFYGKYLYDVELQTTAGDIGEVQGISELNVDDNSIVLRNSSAHTALTGIDLFWKSFWDGGHINDEDGTFTYTAQAISCSRNQVVLQPNYPSGFKVGIRVIATSDMADFHLDGNDVQAPKALVDGSKGGLSYGIALYHEFVGGNGDMFRVTPLAGDQATEWGAEGGVWLTGEECTSNPDLAGVARFSDNVPANIKIVSWENLSISNNSVLGDCFFNVLSVDGNPGKNGAYFFGFVHYTGQALPDPAPSTRKLTMLPVYNCSITNNRAKNDLVYNPETISVGWMHRGFRILLTGINRNIGGAATAHQGGLYQGWVLSGNSSQWYCMTSAPSYSSISDANTEGFDIQYHLGGMLSAARIPGTAQGNFAGQQDNGGAVTPATREVGWDEVLADDSSNHNAAPWIFPV